MLIALFIHIIEQYVTAPTHALVQDAFAESLLKIIIANAHKAMNEPNNVEVRAQLMWTATLALNGIIGAGASHDWATHMIGHELTALYDIDHARTLSIVQFGVWQQMRQQKQQKLLQYATNVWGITTSSEDERIDQAIAKTEQFFQSLGMPTRLSEVNLDQSAVDAVVKQLEAHGMTALGEAGNITPEISRLILQHRL